MKPQETISTWICRPWVQCAVTQTESQSNCPSSWDPSRDPEMKFLDCQESVTEQRGREGGAESWERDRVSRVLISDNSDIDTVIRWHVSVSGWQGAATRWQGQIRNTDWCPVHSDCLSAQSQTLSSVVQCQDQLLAYNLGLYCIESTRALRILSVPDVPPCISPCGLLFICAGY